MEISVTIVDEISRSAHERQLATLLAVRIARPVARARMNGSRIPTAHLIDHLRLAHILAARGGPLLLEAGR